MTMRWFGDDDGEMDGASLAKAMRAHTRARRARPRVGFGDVAVLCFALAALAALGWWAL